MSVVGIGGVFFRADNPEALQAWYDRHLGVVVDFAAPWVPQPGPTLFMPFKRDADHFPLDRQWMINFRVRELDKLISALRGAGIEVTPMPNGIRRKPANLPASMIRKVIRSNCGNHRWIRRLCFSVWSDRRPGGRLRQR